jgi:hypothetical protein
MQGLVADGLGRSYLTGVNLPHGVVEGQVEDLYGEVNGVATELTGRDVRGRFWPISM